MSSPLLRVAGRGTTMKTMWKYFLGALLICGVSTVAHAASDGNSGTTSTGTSDISVVVPKLVKITHVGNLSQTYDGGAGGFNQNDDVCIYGNMDTGAGQYTVKINGGSNGWAGGTAAGFFVGSNAVGMELAYTVKWNDVAGTTGNAAVTHNTDLQHQTGYSNATDCNDAPNSVTNANFQVQMTQAGLLALRPGTYTGTITILITPE